MYNSSTGKWYNGTVQSGGSGTVTSITAGTGLSGGTITSSGTIALNQETLTAIDKGATAYGWGDHAQAGYLKQSALTGYATQQWVGQQGFLKASDLNGYATQQWVQQQNYLTSHQSVDGTFWGQSWTNHGTVKGSIEAGSNGGSISGFHSIELNNHGTLSGYGGFIDFHYNGSSADYTSRIIEDVSGRLFFDAPAGVRIGDGMLVWDGSNNALKAIKADGTSINFYATGGVSALGLGTGGGGGGATALSELVDVALSNPQNGQVLMYNSSTGKWYNGTVQSGGGGTVTSITAGTGLSGGTITSSGTIALSQEMQTAIANGVTAYGWGDHAQAGYLTQSAISDMATKTWVGQQGYLTSSAISDMATKTWVGQQGYLTSSAIIDMATKTWVR